MLLLLLSFECPSRQRRTPGLSTAAPVRSEEMGHIFSYYVLAREDFLRDGVSLGPLALTGADAAALDEATIP